MGEVAEVVVVSVLLFTLVFLAIQLAIWSHAAHVAQAAADTGGEAARAYGSTPQAGTTAADDYLARLASGLILDPSVSSSLGAGDTTVVTVSGHAESILPFFSHEVKAVSVGARQEFRQSG